MTFKKELITLVTASALAVGCGSSSGGSDGGTDLESSYSGNTSSATVTTTNMETAARTAAIGAEKSIEIDFASDASPFSITRNLSRSIAATARTITPRISGSETYYSEICTGGGSVRIDYDINDEGYGDYDMDFNNCVVSEGMYTITYDGSMYWEYNSDESEYYEYDITISYDGETYTLNTSMSCDEWGDCTYQENFSYSGTDYRVADVEVYYSYYGYDIDATVFHEDMGYITIEAEDLVACEDSGYFESGTIGITDSTNTEIMTVTFDSCTSMTVTFDSVGYTVSQ